MWQGNFSRTTDLRLSHWHSPNGEIWEGETGVVRSYSSEPVPLKYLHAPLHSVSCTSARASAEGKAFR